MFISIIGATIFIFALTRVGPDPRYLYIPETGGIGIQEDLWEELGEQLGINDPLPVQYGKWVWRMLQGDMGESIGTLRPVSSIIWQHLPATLWLALGAWIFAAVVGLSMGILASVKRATFGIILLEHLHSSDKRHRNSSLGFWPLWSFPFIWDGFQPELEVIMTGFS